MQRRPRQRLFGLLAFGVVIVLANALGLLRPVKAAVGVIAAPVQSALSHAGNGSSGVFATFGSVNKLAGENQQLKSRVAALQQQLSQDAELRAQNTELRKQLNFGTAAPGKLTAAEVLGYQPDNFRQVVTISRGSLNGIRPGMAVVSQGSLVGKVSEVTATTAKVFLVTDPSFRVAVLDQTQISRPAGVVQGQIGNGLTMDKIAQNETVKQGDVVITSGLGDTLPKGIIVGRVQSVDKQDNGVFQSAQLSSDIVFNRLEIVYVITQADGS